MCSGCAVAVQTVTWHICRHEWVLCGRERVWVRVDARSSEWSMGSGAWVIKSACVTCWVKCASPHSMCTRLHVWKRTRTWNEPMWMYASEYREFGYECECANMSECECDVRVSVLAHLHQCVGCQFRALLWYWVSFLVDHRPLMPEWTNRMGRWPV